MLTPVAEAHSGAVSDLVLAEEIGSYEDDPVGFCRDVLNLELDPWQCRFLEAIREHQRVAVRSSTGQGKDFIAAAGVLWFLASYYKAWCPTTANSEDQLRLVLWKQFSELISGSEGLWELFEWTVTSVRHRAMPAEWMAFAKTSAKKISKGGERHAEGSAGHHAENMLILLDEASGIEEEFWQAYEPTLTGPNNKLIALSNPNRLSGSFHQIWFSRQVAGFWSRFTIGGKPSAQGAAAQATGDNYFVSNRGNQSGNHEYLLRKWGTKHPIVQSKVFGIHPTIAADDTGYAFDEVMAARRQGRVTPSVDDSVQIGVDVAGFGDDETVYMIRRGRLFRQIVERKQSRDHILDMLWQLSQDEPDANAPDGMPLIVIDEAGLHDIVGSFRRLASSRGTKARIRGVSFGGGARSPRAYRNLAAEMWLKDLKAYFECGNCGRHYEAHNDDAAEERCDRYEPLLEIPDDDELMHQLISRRYGFTGKGDGHPATKTQMRFVEPKKEMKLRGIGSPDRADALCLAVVRPREPRIR